MQFWRLLGPCSVPPTMAQPDRKRDRFKKSLGKIFIREHDQTPLATAGNLPAPPTPAPSNTPAAPVSQEAKESRRMEILSSIRTVLDIAEKVLDGCPIWGPKAAVAATSQVLKTMQTSLENKQGINDVAEVVQKIAEVLTPTTPTSPTCLSSGLQARISQHIEDLRKTRTSTDQWKKGEKNVVRRLLDAERVAKELEGVMRQIDAANWRVLLKTAVSTEGKVEHVQKDVEHVQEGVNNIQEGVDNVQDSVNVLKVHVGAIGQNVLDASERDLLGRLRSVKEAFHDHAANASEMCMDGTRQALLAELTAWFENIEPSAPRIFWLNGLAGTGKTTVARTMADWAQQRGRLAATFFFSRNIDATRVPSAIIPTLAYQIARYQPGFRPLICTSIASDEDIRDRSIASQAKTLLGSLSSAATPNAPLLIVLDALDECHLEDGCEGGSAIPLLFAQTVSVPSIKILLTSRMEDTIKRKLGKMVNRQIALHDIESTIVQDDIRHYLARSLEKLASEWDLAPPFPAEGVIGKLVQRAGTLFIYAATVVKWVSDSKEQPDLRLQQILEQDPDELPYHYRPLDRMYAQILSQAAQTTGSVKVRERALRNVLSAVVSLQEPVRAVALASLAGEESQTRLILPLLASVLVVNADEPVRLFHASFPDFLTDEERCQDKRFLVLRSEGHLHLAVRCLEIMNTVLRQDICNIGDASLFNDEVDGLDQLLEHAAPSELRYACKYWHVHVCSSTAATSNLTESLEVFCTTHLLHWVELLSLLGEIRSALAGFRLLLTHLRGIQAFREKSFDVLLADLERLVLANSTPIHTSALHVYHSAVVTMPSCLLWDRDARKCDATPLLRSPRSPAWGSLIRFLECPDAEAWSVAYSPDGQHIASGFSDGKIRVWDTTTGVQQHTLNGHKDKIRSVVFSPNNQLVASGSNDCTMRVWDITTGMEQHTMYGHKSLVRSVAFSPDGQYIVSTSGNSMQIWHATTGTQQYLIGHVNVSCAIFSPSGQYVVSGSLDGTVLVWNMSTGMQQHLVSTAANRGHQGYIQSVAFSPNVQHIASGSDIRGTVQVWDITAGTQQYCATDDGKGWVKSVAFSPDGQRIACGFNNTVHVLDIKMGTQQYVLNGHEDDVCSVAFSPDGRHIVSASKDSTVRVWDATTDAQHHSTSGLKCGITSLKFWSDGRYVVSGSIGDMVQVWDTTTGMRLLLSHNKHGPKSVAFSPNGQLIAFGHHNHTVRVWNAGMGTQQLIIHGHKSTVRCIVFSPNSQFVASASDYQFAVQVWDTTTGTQQITMNGHRRAVNSVAFSPDGHRIVSTSDDYTVRVWDARTGTQQHCLTGHRDRVLSAVFSPDGQYIASGSRDHTLRVWDSSTGTQRHIMTNDDRVSFVAFTPSGQHIVSGSYSRRHVHVWDTTTGTLDQSMIGHEGAVYSVAFSHDGQYVTAICSKSIIRDSDEHFRYTNSFPHVGVGLVWDASTGASITTYGLGDDRRVASAFTQHPTMVYSLDIETGWISRTDFQGVPKRLCWLPKERRGRLIAAWGQKVCIGATSGTVTILDFSNVMSP